MSKVGYKYLVEHHGDEIKKMYLEDNMTLKEIGKIYDVKYYIVGRALKFLDVKLRNHSEVTILNNEKYDTMGRTYNLNKDYFKTWSSDMSYILGFIASDGNIHKKDRMVDGKTKQSNSLNIGLSSVDIEHLKIIKSKLEYTGIVREYIAKIKDKEYPSCSLNITSKHLVNDLISLGIETNKSLKIKFPNIPEKYELDFIRGYFDGNGSVGHQYPSRSITAQIRVRIFSGSEKLLFGIQEVLQKYGLKFKNVNKSKGKEVYEICYSTKESLLLYDLFYKDVDCMKLKRKYDKFKEIIEIRNKDIENNNTKIKVGN